MLSPTTAKGQSLMIHRVKLLILFCLVVPWLSGCSKKTEDSPSSSKENVQAAKKDDTKAGGDAAEAPKPAGAPLKIAYSDWPGWVAWEIAIQKGWFKEEGVPVDFSWFEYVPSMEAYSAGKVDAVAMTNGDALVTGSSGTPSLAIIINDYSNGNDMVVAKPGIESVAQLKGKTVGVEVGFVSHLLLMNALKKANLTDKDIQIKNVPTDQTPQTLKSGEVDAIVAWQPNSGQALKEVPGSKAIFTSRDVPGIIYDVLAVNPKSLKERRNDWLKVVKVWGRVADFIKDEKNVDEAAKIMSARVGLKPDEYKKLMDGTRILTLDENLKHYEKGGDLSSIYFSNKTVDDFQVKNDVYKKPMPFEQYIDSSLVEEVVKGKK